MNNEDRYLGYSPLFPVWATSALVQNEWDKLKAKGARFVSRKEVDDYNYLAGDGDCDVFYPAIELDGKIYETFSDCLRKVYGDEAAFAILNGLWNRQKQEREAAIAERRKLVPAWI